MAAPVSLCGILLRLATYSSIFHMAPAACAASISTPPPAYNLEARKAGVPSNLLFAVALQESGITLRGLRIPWPWTLNIAGQGRYFIKQTDACSALQSALSQWPASRIDVGLTQINLGHQRRFYRHPCEVLWPHRNLEIAAIILREQYRTGESWLLAAGRYHRPSGGPLAARYRRRIERHLEQLALAMESQP
ncbi:transglycosylase SLT domain-containing protein [Pseudomonas sp. lyk4-TYG-107]|uniref:transglycosylase SLT domain-containing protein n=1 Tax=Pseudomonas sp. lyk4-TYG-107 TaxID=3040317 RepID=UPI002555F622|nr:transglycosylase SLT domain-containing protein [Pseudomonas sp. lyk4-TYG-107]